MVELLLRAVLRKRNSADGPETVLGELGTDEALLLDVSDAMSIPGWDGYLRELVRLSARTAGWRSLRLSH
ncbi:MAG: hypothetical protein WD472_08155 [Dehalococcoidia bacterium]